MLGASHYRLIHVKNYCWRVLVGPLLFWRDGIVRALGTAAQHTVPVRKPTPSRAWLTLDLTKGETGLAVLWDGRRVVERWLVIGRSQVSSGLASLCWLAPACRQRVRFRVQLALDPHANGIERLLEAVWCEARLAAAHLLVRLGHGLEFIR